MSADCIAGARRPKSKAQVDRASQRAMPDPRLAKSGAAGPRTLPTRPSYSEAMTRLDRLLLHMPRLRRLVLDREAFAAHCTRLQRELDENLERERTLCQELETSAKDARALTAHGTRLQGELDGILERERTLRQELETSAEEARALTAH